MTRITVITPTYKATGGWPVLPLQAAALAAQTFPLEEVLWVIVDDLHAQREGMAFPPGLRVIHVPPRVIREEADMCGAMNTGLLYAEGELVHFMVDYMVPLPGVLARHWSLYQSHGPDVLISGPLRMAPLLADGSLGEPTPGYYAEREWGDRAVNRIPVTTPAGVAWVHRYAWMGRNDSAPLAALVKANGFDERYVGSQGGDPESAIRLINAGCRYVLDRKRGDGAALFLSDHVRYPGYGKKRPNGISYFQDSLRTRKTFAENGGWDLAGERSRRLTGVDLQAG